MFRGSCWNIIFTDSKMELVDVRLSGPKDQFCLKGECPFCCYKAAFPSQTTTHTENFGQKILKYAPCRCESCKEVILGILKFKTGFQDGTSMWEYYNHYPKSFPEDEVPDEIPESIKVDYKEAIKNCRIGSYKSCVLMCRRALEKSCLIENAKGKNLFEMIDYLAKAQVITKPLQEWAHLIRILGNKGGHPDKQEDLYGVDTIEEKDAFAAIDFLKHYFFNVYVLTKKLEEYEKKFEQSKKE